MDNVTIRSIELEGIHQRYDLNLQFFDSLNVLHGQNGTGKSTLIHILANIANCDFLRFIYLDFKSITVGYSSGLVIKVLKSEDGNTYRIKNLNALFDPGFVFYGEEAIKSLSMVEDEKVSSREYVTELMARLSVFIEKNGIPRIKTSYFPAFRTMLEAWSSQFEEDVRRYSRAPSYALPTQKVTSFARNLFGKFLPVINYPSPLSIEHNLREEIRDAHLKIARYESSVFSDSFVKVFSAILSDEEGTAQEAERLLEEISELTTETALNKLANLEGPSYTYVQLQNLVGRSRESKELASSATGALTVYRDALKERRDFQANIFAKIDKYFDAVNAFLEQKELHYVPDSSRRIPKVGLKFKDGAWSSIRVMSSGERQLLTMLYAVTKMSADSLVLIDEPELSLHIDWQEELLGKMMAQLGGRQIIVCTHSPSIASDYRDFMIEVVPVLSDSAASRTDISDDDEEVI
ncbi:AAA family ATPase [Pseudomonas sp. FW300-N1A1]|uniref:AAA family ATPase n=1 Tax=Pseudomonas sp. FW300-N1A1 TaxID=2075555 RepID=UPI000CD2352F|nr:AAA family ATPase [Pseudomonas sp. FW300-N1A1]POA21604.1 AAA family ATPase [Pseudomonas sp. FW300-N1A1]